MWRIPPSHPPPLSVDVPFIDPTGVYSIEHKTTMGGQIYGYWGEIKVKLVERGKILLSLTIHNGAPNNSSGSFIDTLKYNRNIAVYTPSNNPACQIRFRFTDGGVDVAEELVDLHSDCFGKHGAIAGGFYKKISAEF